MFKIGVGGHFGPNHKVPGYQLVGKFSLGGGWVIFKPKTVDSDVTFSKGPVKIYGEPGPGF